eukprot:352556-Chlamydomonas_euryale.AAC.7
MGRGNQKNTLEVAKRRSLSHRSVSEAALLRASSTIHACRRARNLHVLVYACVHACIQPYKLWKLRSATPAVRVHVRSRDQKPCGRDTGVDAGPEMLRRQTGWVVSKLSLAFNAQHRRKARFAADKAVKSSSILRSHDALPLATYSMLAPA